MFLDVFLGPLMFANEGLTRVRLAHCLVTQFICILFHVVRGRVGVVVIDAQFRTSQSERS